MAILPLAIVRQLLHAAGLEWPPFGARPPFHAEDTMPARSISLLSCAPPFHADTMVTAFYQYLLAVMAIRRPASGNASTPLRYTMPTMR